MPANTMRWVYGNCTNCGRECVVRVLSDRERLCELCETPESLPPVFAGDGYIPSGNTGGAPLC